MKKIFLACNAGMSTNMLVAKMRQVAKEIGSNVEIEAGTLPEMIGRMDEAAIILLGPQIASQKADAQAKAAPVPVAVIDQKDYGMLNGKKVLFDALSKIVE